MPSLASILRTPVVSGLILAGAGGCAGLDFTPSTVESYTNPALSLADVERVVVLSVADSRAFDRGAAVPTAVSTREAALSVLREKGYDVETAGGELLDLGADSRVGDVLDAALVVRRAPSGAGVVLAIAVEETTPDVAVAPATSRVRLRGALVNVADSSVMWRGESVAESGPLSGVARISPTAAAYGTIYQSMRALLADVPDR
jgi:hypothetical protein